jgi:hypothetical protein
MGWKSHSKKLFRTYLQELRKTWGRTVGAPYEIRTHRLPNISRTLPIQNLLVAELLYFKTLRSITLATPICCVIVLLGDTSKY